MTKRAKERNPKTTLKLPDLEPSKNAVLNSLPFLSSRRSYDHAIEISSTGTVLSHGCRSIEPL